MSQFFLKTFVNFVEKLQFQTRGSFLLYTLSEKVVSSNSFEICICGEAFRTHKRFLVSDLYSNMLASIDPLHLRVVPSFSSNTRWKKLATTIVGNFYLIVNLEKKVMNNCHGLPPNFGSAQFFIPSQKISRKNSTTGSSVRTYHFEKLNEKQSATKLLQKKEKKCWNR